MKLASHSIKNTINFFKIGSAFPSYTTELGIMTSQTELPTQKIFSSCY